MRLPDSPTIVALPVFAALLAGCVTPPETSDGPAAKPPAEQGNKSKAKAKAPAGKTGKTGQKGGKTPPKPKPVGIAGELSGVMKLTPEESEQGPKTKAELALSWEGGEKVVFLGKAPGTCEPSEPRPRCCR